MHPAIHIIIPMAGHSRRFQAQGLKGPKALLPVGKMTMIEHVVSMFGQHDHFHFVINEEQQKETPDIVQRLKVIAARADVSVIPSHENGPTFSALQVQGIPDDAPVTIAYCDFTVRWDYRAFLGHVSQADAGAPSFRGFHPASLGDTYYAYMRVDGDRMVELREKRSFTPNRMEEHASTGIYYFASSQMFRHYAERLLAEHDYARGEAYTSVLLNMIVADGKEVIVHDVDHFICLGTPGDYRQYLYWYDYLHRPQQRHLAPPPGFRQINLVPMAGRGSRFRDYGYRVAKPLIPVRGEPMMLRATASLPPATDWIFLPRAVDLERHPIADTVRAVYPQAKFIPVAETTSGQAATCLLAENMLDPDAAVCIASCDYEHAYDPESWQAILNDPSIDGAIWTCRMDMSMVRNPVAFAYCVTGVDQRTVTKVVEKRLISDNPSLDPMVVGTFWYRCARDFIWGAKTMIEKGITVNGEHYVGTSINQLIEAGKRFVIFDVIQWVSFGDPHEMQILGYWDNYFHKLKD